MSEKLQFMSLSSRLLSHSKVPLIAKYDGFEKSYFGINIREGEPCEIIMDHISGT
jgi:hypothetical protein